MQMLGKVESLWRYPVKSMRGEELRQAFVGFGGVYGDRWYAFTSAAAHKGFPYLTAREKVSMLQYRPVFRDAQAMFAPPNLAEATALGPGVTAIYPAADALPVDVQAPTGEKLAIDDPALPGKLQEGLRERHELALVRSHRSMTDCRPISLFSLQTVRQMSQEVGADLDKRRFRANIYADLEADAGFGEDEWVGLTLRIGERAVVSMVE